MLNWEGVHAAMEHQDEKTTVVIVEDGGLYRELLKVALSRYPHIDVVGDFGDGEHALREIPRLNPRVAVLDIELRGPLHSVELGLKLRRILPELSIVLLCNHQVPELLYNLPTNVTGGWSCLLKQSISNVDALMRALTAAACGLVTIDPHLIAPKRRHRTGPLGHLTSRQWDVLELMAQGYTNAAIAKRLFLTEKTVENQINVLYQQLQIDRSDSAVQPRVTAVLTYLNTSHRYTLSHRDGLPSYDNTSLRSAIRNRSTARCKCR